MQKIRLKYAKTGRMRFVGHLDLIRAFERAFRRTDLPVAYSEGFNPRQKLAWGPPLSLGIESECELLDATFERWTKPEEVKDKLNAVLPEGLSILEAVLGNPKSISIVEEIKASQFVVTIDASVRHQLKNKLVEFEAAKDILIVRKREKGNKTVNLKKLTQLIRLDDHELTVIGESSNHGSLKIFELTEWLGLPREALLSVKRTKALT